MPLYMNGCFFIVIFDFVFSFVFEKAMAGEGEVGGSSKGQRTGRAMPLYIKAGCWLLEPWCLRIERAHTFSLGACQPPCCNFGANFKSKQNIGISFENF